MAKQQKDLRPTDTVMVGFGAKTQMDPDSGETIIIEGAKESAVPYAYFQAITASEDDYNERTGYVRMIGRTVKLLGLAVYSDGQTDTGESISVPGIEAFDTEESLAAKAKADAEAKAKADAKAEKAKADAEAKAKAKADAETVQ